MDPLTDKTKARVNAATKFENELAIVGCRAVQAATSIGEMVGQDIPSSIMELVRQIGFSSLDALEFANRDGKTPVLTDEIVAFFAKIGVHQ